ncbi:fratricide two-peptide bacteriocin subunit CibB [Pseudolactococcus yaeyamensis]
MSTRVFKFNNFNELDESELTEVKGGIASGIIIALFMAGYTIGKDIAKR